MDMPTNLPEPQLSENAMTLLKARYLQTDENTGKQETPREMFWRVASHIANACKIDVEKDKEQLAKDFYYLMASLKFLPNSPTLMNAGTPSGQLAACFVLPIEDDLEAIFETVKQAALIHKSGGGTGFSFSNLRPAGSNVGSTGGAASGPVSFMKVFNAATEQIKQGGKRRGANMGILRIDHPDIFEFIQCKRKEGELTNFNISVGITDKFMQAVEIDKYFDLINPQTGKAVKSVRAKELFDLLVDCAWQSGDPGVIFLDTINKANPFPELGKIEATNPCGEVPLLPYEACNLGSINLAKFVRTNADGGKEIEWDELAKTVETAVIFLDSVIEATVYPLPEIEARVKQTRKIGLGVMGFADLLTILGIQYNTPQGVATAIEVMKMIRDQARITSKWLVIRGGEGVCQINGYFRPQRNGTITTIAPTGSLSIIAGCSSGIEPNFALAYTRNILDGKKLVEINPYFQNALDKLDISANFKEEIINDAKEIGSIAASRYAPVSLRNIFVTAMDILPEWHIRMQAAFQCYTDNAVSKTINMPKSATHKDIADVYKLAWKHGCKGVTVYRDGCKSLQVLATGKRQDEIDGKKENTSIAIATKQRPDIVNGFTQKIKTGLGTLYLTINEIDGKPFEIFATIGKSGGSVTAKAEAIGRLVSLALRSGVDLQAIIEQLKGIGGDHPIVQGEDLLLSIPDAIARVLASRYQTDAVVETNV